MEQTAEWAGSGKESRWSRRQSGQGAKWQSCWSRRWGGRAGTEQKAEPAGDGEQRGAEDGCSGVDLQPAWPLLCYGDANLLVALWVLQPEGIIGVSHSFSAGFFSFPGLVKALSLSGAGSLCPSPLAVVPGLIQCYFIDQLGYMFPVCQVRWSSWVTPLRCPVSGDPGRPA